METKKLDEFNIYSYVGDIILRNISSRIADFVSNQFLLRAVIPTFDKIRFKRKLIKTLKDEVSTSLKSAADEEGMPEQFLKRRSKAVAKSILNSPEVKFRIKSETQKLSGGEDQLERDEAIKNISEFLSKESTKEIKKQWKEEGRKEMKEGIMTIGMPTTMRRLIEPFAQDDFDSGSSFISPFRRPGFSVQRSFIDGLSSELITISNRGRKLQINPATREAYIAQGGRSVYLGTLDTWTDVHLRKLILRYLGDMPDALVNTTLRDLGLIENESTMSTSIAIPSVPMAGTFRRRRRRRDEI